ncbi:MAG: hypothetical protein ACTSRZ_04140 [Promethearchaeota archaeon]
MPFEQEKVIELLTNIRNQLYNSFKEKEEIIKQLQEEIEQTRKLIRNIDEFINANTIMTADMLLDTEEFLKRKSNKQIENVDITKKIYFRDNESLLALAKYNGEKMEIYFPNPQKLRLTASEERYLSYIIEPLIPIKNKEPNLKLTIEKKNEQNYITKLLIEGIKNIENIENIFGILENLKKIEK